MNNLAGGGAQREHHNPSSFEILIALSRALGSTVGQRALRQFLPLYLSIIIAAILVFEGNGLQPATVVDAIHEFLTVRLAFWSLWLLLTMPAVRVIFAASSTSWLRSLPIPRWHFLLILGVFMVVLELPCVLLWLRGGGVLLGLGMLSSAVSAHALLLLGRPFRFSHVVLMVLTGSMLSFPAPPWLSLMVMPLVGVLSLRLAWIKGAELRRPMNRGISRTIGWRVDRIVARIGTRASPVFALASMHVVVLFREHRTLIIRALLFVCIAMMLSALVMQNREMQRDVEACVKLAVGFLILAIVATTVTWAGPILRSEEAADWFFRVHAVPWWIRDTGSEFALVFMTSLLGCVYGLMLVFADRIQFDHVQFLIICILASWSTTWVSLLLFRRTRTPWKKVVLEICLVVVAILVLIGAGPWGLVGLFFALGVVRSVRRRYSAWVLVDGEATSTSRESSQLLEVIGVKKQIGGRKVLEGITFSCASSDVVVVLGSNGVGKSTLLQILAGILEADRGTVMVDGHWMAGARSELQAKKSIGYAPDIGETFPQLTVREFIHLTRVLKGLPSSFDFGPLRTQLGTDAFWYQRVDTLSLGALKRTYILAAELGHPKVLLLDEPSNGLDQRGTQALVSLLKSRSAEGLVTLLATNDHAFADSLPATRLLLADGRVVPRLETQDN